MGVRNWVICKMDEDSSPTAFGHHLQRLFTLAESDCCIWQWLHMRGHRGMSAHSQLLMSQSVKCSCMCSSGVFEGACQGVGTQSYMPLSARNFVCVRTFVHQMQPPADI